MGNIEKIKPSGIFTNYIFKSIPLAFDESLSYYETLCGILDLLKEQETIVNQNADVLIELENYVTHYFDNLDVQNEINNKLDEMAQSGILQDLLNNQYNELISSVNNQINSFESSVNNQINSIETMVQSVSSGSPLVASSTSEMTDTTKIYVNTSDGKWYYYDGDSWEIGGDYQAAQISNGAIDILKLDDKLQQNFITKYATEVNRGDFYSGYWNINGTLTENESFINYHIPLTLGKTYAIEYFDIAQVTGLLIKDNSNNIIYKSSSENLSSTVRCGCLYFKVNQNNLTAYISRINTTSNTLRFVKNLYCKVYELDSVTNALHYDNSVTLLETLEGKYISSDQNSYGVVLGENVNTNIYAYALEKGKKYSISAYNWSGMAGIVILDFDNTLLYRSCDLDSNIGNTFEKVTKEYTATSNGIILLSKNIASNNYPVSIAAYNEVIEQANKIANKKIGVDGDSIAHGNENSNVSFADLIATNNNMTLNKLAYGGATITYGTQASGGVNRHWICTSVLNLDNDCDLVLIEGGFNDYALSIPMGEITQSMTDAIDNTTFYGALETLARNLLSKFATSKIAFVTTHKINSVYRTSNSVGKTYTDYINAIKEIMKKYSIPVIDLFNNSRFNTELASYKSNYTCNNDGVHPNTLGYEKFYNQLIVNGLNNLL